MSGILHLLNLLKQINAIFPVRFRSRLSKQPVLNAINFPFSCFEICNENLTFSKKHEIYSQKIANSLYPEVIAVAESGIVIPSIAVPALKV
ncbi:hypothetical protein LXL04_005399 [Taraxacum kok-saghyz]